MTIKNDCPAGRSQFLTQPDTRKYVLGWLGLGSYVQHPIIPANLPQPEFFIGSKVADHWVDEFGKDCAECGVVCGIVWHPSDQDLLSFLSPRPRTRKNVVCQKYDCNSDNYIPETAPAPEQNFVLKAETALYSGAQYVTVGGQFYRFNGAFYELQSEAGEKRRVGDWLSTYSEKTKEQRYAYNRAKSSNVAEILNWVAARKGLDPKDINPDGLNCSNGVVQINPDGSHAFTPHSPDRIYTYVGCKYDSDADPTDCDRLLECLTPLHREVFLRTAAAALAVKLVRKKIGRKLKGLLCYGDGNNGKDTLRAALAAVFGRGMTGKTLSDFRDYDKGRKFNIAGIEEALCNWSSENASTVKLDSLQSLKQLATLSTSNVRVRIHFSAIRALFFWLTVTNCRPLPGVWKLSPVAIRFSNLRKLLWLVLIRPRVSWKLTRALRMTRILFAIALHRPCSTSYWSACLWC